MSTSVDDIQLLPWQTIAWQQFLRYYTQHRLPHALLITAAPGLGQLQLAQLIAQLVLCTAPDNNQACGACSSCRLLKSGNHPDYFLLQPEYESKVIKIDAIRTLSHQLAQSAQQSGYKVIIINPADALNIAASNALLKTLEEPMENTLLILLSEHAERLLPTLRSRCQRLTISPIVNQQTQKWLQANNITDAEQWLLLSEHAPLLALELARDETKQTEYATFIKAMQTFQQTQDPIITAAMLIKLDAGNLCVWLSQFYMDIIRLFITGSAQFIAHQGCLSELEQLSKQYSLSTLFAAYDIVIQLYKLLSKPNNVNVQLQLEAALIEIVKL